MNKRLKVLIWSDVMCPYCYIGKRRFEKALEQFQHKDLVDVEYKSYQIAPDIAPTPGQKVEEIMALSRNITIAEAIESNNQATKVAQYNGLTYHFDKVIPANTFNAHRFIHFAKHYNKQSEAEEILFAAYFVDGKNVNDYPTLLALGEELGLDTNQLEIALNNNEYAEAVKADVEEGYRSGLFIVPFYYINSKHFLARVQTPAKMLQMIETAFGEL